MKLAELVEGQMKRSDPVISGDVLNKTYTNDTPGAKTYTSAPKQLPKTSVLQKRLQTIATKAGVSLDTAMTAWRDAKVGVDLESPYAFAIITSKTKRAVGLKEDKEFKNNDLGSLVYGWKDADELRDEEDNPRYIPKMYSKVLELGGIYANKPGTGQGTELMKMFLESPEAQEAELIFLDPVPGLGKNFRAGKNETEQVADLVRFYKRFGFRHNPRSATKRMWLVKKGEIPDDKLPQ